MADETNRGSQNKDGAKPRIEPDQPTPNRDKRRQPPTLDLKAETPRSAAGGEAAGAARSSGTPQPSAGARETKPIGPGSPPSASSEGPGSPGASSEPPRSAAKQADGAQRLGREPRRGESGSPRAARGASVPTVAISLLGAAAVATGAAYALQAYSEANGTIAAMKGRIANLEDRLARVDQQAGAAPTRADVDARFSAINDAIAKRFAAADAARRQASDAIDKRMRNLEEARNQVTAALEKRVGGLEALTTTLGAQIDQANTKAEVVRVQAARAVEAVAKASATPPGAPIVLPPTVDIAPVNAKLKQLEQEVAAMRTAAAKQKDANRVTEARAVMPSPKGNPAYLAIVAQALTGDFESGQPLGRALAAARALGAGDRLAPLQPFADSGPPTMPALAREFEALRPKIAAAAPPPPPAANFLDRLSSGAATIVSVRRTAAAPAGNTADTHDANAVETLASRVAQRLAGGDAPAALADWRKLPQPCRNVSQRWADRLRARIDAAEALHSFSNDAVGALSNPKP